LRTFGLAASRARLVWRFGDLTEKRSNDFRATLEAPWFRRPFPVRALTGHFLEIRTRHRGCLSRAAREECRRHRRLHLRGAHALLL